MKVYVVVKLRRILYETHPGISRYLDYRGVTLVTESIEDAIAEERRIDAIDDYVGITEIMEVQR